MHKVYEPLHRVAVLQRRAWHLRVPRVQCDFGLRFLLAFGASRWQTWRGPFSAVSKPIFASKYSLESSWDIQDLQENIVDVIVLNE